MPKRKLRSNSAEKKTKQSKGNPFLQIDAGVEGEHSTPTRKSSDHEDDLLAHTFVFLEPGNHVGDTERKKLFESLAFLLEFLESRFKGDASTDPSNSDASITRTTTILLPWLAKKLTETSARSSQDDPLLWRALAGCLKDFADQSNEHRDNDGYYHLKQNVLSQTMTTKVQLKLVPNAAQVALSGGLAGIYASSCYDMLLRGHFLPSVDVACKTLFFPIVNDISEGKPGEASPVTTTTLQVLKDALKRANPKTAFQVVSVSETLVAFAQLYFYFEDLPEGKEACDKESQKLILEILCESLFHPEHHLDGFRSIVQLRGVPSLDSPAPLNAPAVEEATKGNPKQSTFQCYQENLLTSLQELLAIPGSQSTKKEKKNTTIIVRLLPFLFQAYLEKMAELDDIAKRATTKRRGSAKFDLAQMQFFFFATASVPLWLLASQCKIQEMNSFALESLSACLQLLLQHDAFVPASNEESQVSRFQLLQALTEGAIETSWPKSVASEHATVMVRTLANLDHRLVDERLETMLVFCASQRTLEENTDSPHSRNLLVALISSYQQLRRFSFFVQNLLAAISTMQHRKKKTSLVAMNSLLSQTLVQQAISSAVQDNPSMEIQNIFDALNMWIVKVSANQADDCLDILALTGVIKHVGVGFLANARVDRSTAAKVADSCGLLMKDSVAALCGKHDNDDGGSESESNDFNHRVKLGVTFCAWLINLQMRCAFWLGHEYIHRSETESAIPQPIRHLLITDAEANSASSPNALHIPDDLMLLASFRLRQLDYLVHEQNVGDSEELSLKDEYKEDARRLAKSMAQWARNGVEVSRWQHIAQVITSWVRYVDEEHRRTFLSWLFTTLADASVKEGSFVTIHPGGRKVHAAAYEKERAVALSLIKDASFLEIDELAGLFAPCAFSIVSILIRESATFWPKPVSDRPTSKRFQQLAVVGGVGWELSSSDQLGSYLKWEKPIQMRRNESTEQVIKLLRGAVKIVKILNGAPTAHNSTVSVACVDAAVRIESFCRRLQSSDLHVKALLQDLIAVLRLAITKNLSSASLEALVLMPSKSETRTLLEDLKKTSKHTLECIGDAEDEQGRRFIFATASFVLAFAGCIIRGNVSDKSVHNTMLEYLVAESSHTKKSSDMEEIIFCVHGKALLEALCWPGNLTCEYDTVSEMMFTLLCNIDSLAKSTSSSLLRFHRCLLSGALFRFIANACSEGTPTRIAERIEHLANTSLSLILVDNGNGNDLDAVFYMVSCFAMTKPQSHQRLSIIEQLLDRSCEGAWLEASICSLVRDMKGDTLHSALSGISEKVQAGSIPSLRLFRVILHTVENEEQVQTMSGFSEVMLEKALEALNVRDGNSKADKAIATASSLIVNLTQDRRVLAVRERDIALILAQSCKAMNFANQNNDISSSCFSLVANICQRFPKQLYTTAPSLIAMLQSFLRHVLYDQLDDVAIRDRSQKFTRLIELLLPHKEVYKKHVLCLLIEFVHCLERDLSLFRKECLLPSVFYLLDMLSKYEMQQLNILMDTTAKTLFRSIHQSYEKLHAYKGQ